MKTLKRRVESTLDELLSTMPLVLVTGVRQAGKSTLAQKLASEPRRFSRLTIWMSESSPKAIPRLYWLVRLR